MEIMDFSQDIFNQYRDRERETKGEGKRVRPRNGRQTF